jgi:hypothetical protein
MSHRGLQRPSCSYSRHLTFGRWISYSGIPYVTVSSKEHSCLPELCTPILPVIKGLTARSARSQGTGKVGNLFNSSVMVLCTPRFGLLGHFEAAGDLCVGKKIPGAGIYLQILGAK